MAWVSKNGYIIGWTITKLLAYKPSEPLYLNRNFISYRTKTCPKQKQLNLKNIALGNSTACKRLSGPLNAFLSEVWYMMIHFICDLSLERRLSEGR